MTRYFKFNRLGYCPIQNEEETIEIKTAEIRMLGATSPGYKKMGFYCEYGDDNDCKISNNCPIFMESPSDPFLT